MSYRTAVRSSVAFFAAAISLAVARPAAADPKTEGAAKALEQKAMQEDYLSTDFDKALEKLNRAQTMCGTDKCSSQLRATIKRDIGVIQIAGKNNRDAGIATFVEAIKIDGSIALDPDVRTKDLDAAWADAKKQGAAPASSAGVPGAPPSGDFAVAPVPNQQAHTPLPVYAEYGGTETLAKVVLKYKAFGMPDWKTTEMKKMGNGWGAEVPCADVQQGEVQFYVQGFNANNDPVATSGDRNNPFKTVVKREAVAEPPHFPGAEPPKQCQEVGDCPPDFPGCKKEAPPGEAAATEPTGKDEGDSCEEDSECKSGTCKTGQCTAPESTAPKRAKLWIGVQGELDFVSLPGGNDVCVLDPATGFPLGGNYYCVDGAGNDYPGRKSVDPTGIQNGNIQRGKSDRVQGGFAPSNIRIMLSLDYAFTANILAGIRLGYVLNTYPGTAAGNDGKTFAPIHVEARFTYVIGKDALAKAGLNPYVMAAAGVSEWDANVGVTAIENVNNTPVTRNVNAWTMSGPGFASIGGGLRYAFTPRAALLIGPRANMAFGSNGTLISLSPELGLQYGF